AFGDCSRYQRVLKYWPATGSTLEIEINSFSSMFLFASASRLSSSASVNRIYSFLAPRSRGQDRRARRPGCRWGKTPGSECASRIWRGGSESGCLGPASRRKALSESRLVRRKEREYGGQPLGRCIRRRG